jgi:maltose O-acetyltransferase
MLDGELYLASDPECDRQMEMCKKWMSRLNSTGIGLPPQERRALVAERVNIGAGTQLFPPFYCDYGGCCGIHQDYLNSYFLWAENIGAHGQPAIK